MTTISHRPGESPVPAENLAGGTVGPVAATGTAAESIAGTAAVAPNATPNAAGPAIRSWGLHGLVVASAAASVAIDRRLRAKGRNVSPRTVPAVATLAIVGVVRWLEKRHPHDPTWAVQRSELVTDAATAIAGSVTGLAIETMAQAVSGRAGAAERRTLGLSRCSPAVGAVAALLAYDLFHSPLHHLMHVWGPGWRLHSVHHSPTRLNSINTVRFQFLELVIDKAIEEVVMPRLGLSRDQYVAYLALRNYGVLQHANVDVRSGVLDHVFSTPDLHRWHHSAVYEEGDTNFGSVLSVWDKLFGTWYRPDDRDCPDALGVGRMPDFPTRFLKLQRVPLDWAKIRERNAATWYATSEAGPASRRFERQPSATEPSQGRPDVTSDHELHPVEFAQPRRSLA